MSTIVTRAGKGSPLTNAEMDANLNNLNTDKAELLVNQTFTGLQKFDVGVGEYILISDNLANLGSAKSIIGIIDHVVGLNDTSTQVSAFTGSASGLGGMYAVILDTGANIQATFLDDNISECNGSSSFFTNGAGDIGYNISIVSSGLGGNFAIKVVPTGATYTEENINIRREGTYGKFANLAAILAYYTTHSLFVAEGDRVYVTGQGDARFNGAIWVKAADDTTAIT